MRRMISGTISIIIFIVLTVSLCHVARGNAAETAQAIFDESNGFFLLKQYDEARVGYERLIRMGYKDAAVYFNLSNTYMLLNMRGKAALNLNRAKKLEPRDEDIKKNLRALQSAIERDTAGRDSVTTENLATDRGYNDVNAPFTFKHYVRSFPMTKNEASAATLLFYLLFFVWSLLRKFLKSGATKFIAGIAASVAYVLALFFIVIFVSSFYYENFHPEAIVLETVELRSSPSEDDSYRSGIIIYAGSPVETVRSYNGWGEVASRADGVTGWIKEESLENL